jgi:hypothetical protein
MLALLTLAVLLPGVSAGAMSIKNSPPDFAAIDAYVDAQMRALRIPGLALGVSATKAHCVNHVRFWPIFARPGVDSRRCRTTIW